MALALGTTMFSLAFLGFSLRDVARLNPTRSYPLSITVEAVTRPPRGTHKVGMPLPSLHSAVQFFADTLHGLCAAALECHACTTVCVSLGGRDQS